MYSKIAAIEYFLPSNVLTNEELAGLYENWSAEKIEKKTGIKSRHIAGSNETASDLGFSAAKKLFKNNNISPEDIDFIIFCTESPDYPLPPGACVLQARLNIPKTAGAFDYNLGCSGFVYGLGISHGLIYSGQARNILLITAETYSKYIHPQDKSVRTIFGDGAAATLISESLVQNIGPFVYGTDGGGCANLIVGGGGACSKEKIAELEIFKKTDFPENLYMNGPEIFNFTIQTVPNTIASLLAKAGLCLNDIDYFVFHQANKYILEHLRRKMNIPKEKFFIDLQDTGNTVSATIPIGLKKAADNFLLKSGFRVLIVGFGVGYSWAATLLNWE